MAPGINNEETYQHIFHVAVDALFLVDRTSGKILDANHSACCMYGYSHSELLSMNCVDLSDEPEKTVQALREVQEGHTIVPVRQHRKKDGTVFPVEIQASLFTVKSRELLLISTHDITRRMQAEMALRESEERFKGLSEAVFDGVVIHDHGLILDCNSGLSEITGFGRDELIGKDGLDLIAPESQGTVRANIKNGYEKRYEVVGLRKDGSTYPMAIRGKNVNYKGRAVRVIEFSDITEIKRAEEKLRESENLLSRAQEISHTGSWELDLSTNLLTWSDETYRILGCIPQEFPSTYDGFFDFIHPEDREKVDRAYKNSLLNGQSGYEIEHRIIRKHSGEIRHVVERCVHESDSNGTIIKSIGMVQDITSQVETEQALVESEKRFREVVRSLNAGIIVHAPDTSIIDCNDRASELLGLNKEQLLGKVAVDPEWRFLSEDELPMPQEEFPVNLILSNKGSIKDILLGVYRPESKKIVWLTVNGTAIYDSRGDISEVVISFVDITREREQLKEIEISRQRLSNILESTNVGTWEWNIQTGEMIYNERWAQMIGYTLDEIAPVNSETFLRFVHPEDSETGKKIRMEVFEKELVRYDIEIRIKHKDGRWVWVQDRGMVTSWTADGKPLTMSGTHSDINLRKQIEIDLRKTTLQNQRILDRLQDAYFQIDLSGIIRIANPSAAAIFGYPSNREMLGLPAAALYADPKDRERLYHELTEKGELKDYHFQGLRSDGTLVSCSTHVQFTKDEEGEINGVESLCRDITEYKKLEEGIKRQRDILEESNKKLEHMLEQSVNAISRIGELRDAYTAGHQQRVQELSCAIARHMGLSEEDIVILSYGALIHDIGKIYISSDILNKPGKITDLEYQILQTHAEYGYSVIKGIDFPERIPMMVHQHHERMDGSGYPQGLRGDQIILESRILAVADVVEAMTSHRPYRAALGVEAALDEIMQHKGTKYDAAVVTSCVHLFRSEIFSFLS